MSAFGIGANFVIWINVSVEKPCVYPAWLVIDFYRKPRGQQVVHPTLAVWIIIIDMTESLGFFYPDYYLMVNLAQ